LALRAATAGLTGEFTKRAGDQRLALGTVVVTIPAADLTRAWQRFATIIIAAFHFYIACAGDGFRTIVIAAVFLDAIWHTDFALK
jgi:hypothetical protein